MWFTEKKKIIKQLGQVQLALSEAQNKIEELETALQAEQLRYEKLFDRWAAINTKKLPEEPADLLNRVFIYDFNPNYLRTVMEVNENKFHVVAIDEIEYKKFRDIICENPVNAWKAAYPRGSSLSDVRKYLVENNYLVLR